MDKLIRQQIQQHLHQFTTLSDSDNRGLSDLMLFYTNVYHSIHHLRLPQYKKDILKKAKQLLSQYNSQRTHDFFGCLFFELYFNTFKKISKNKLKGTCKHFTVPQPTMKHKRDFIHLYHNFGIYWAQKCNLVNHQIQMMCFQIDPNGSTFVALMGQMKQDMYTKNAPLLSWTHNHYGYFSTLFYTQSEPTELKINKQKLIIYLKQSLHHSYQTRYSVDYIGECIEMLLRMNQSIPKYMIQYLLDYESNNNSYHYLTTGSIIPLSEYLKHT